MPLTPGTGRQVVSQNIRELMASGQRPQKQAVAIAMKEAGKSNQPKKKNPLLSKL